MQDKSFFSLWWADILSALAFLTRLPIPIDQELRERPIAEAMRAFSLAGALVGLGAGLTYWVAGILSLSHFECAVMAVIASLLITGAFHEDGFADVWDGIGGGQTKEAKLHIMHDSRLGTYGAAALVLALMLKVGTVAAIGNAEGHIQALGVLMAAGALSRTALTAVSHALPMAQPDGQAAGAGQASFDHVRDGALVALIVAVLTVGIAETILASLVMGTMVYVWCRFAHKQVGGQTGDVLGSVQVVGELSALVVLSAMIA